MYVLKKNVRNSNTKTTIQTGSVPLDRTKRSLLKYEGLRGENRITYFQRATPIAAMPMAPLHYISENKITTQQ